MVKRVVEYWKCPICGEVILGHQLSSQDRGRCCIGFCNTCKNHIVIIDDKECFGCPFIVDCVFLPTSKDVGYKTYT